MSGELNIQDFQFPEDDTELSIQATSSNQRKKRAANRVFKIVSQHESAEEAIEIINNLQSYSTYRKFKSIEGERTEYRCNKVKLRGPQCASAYQIMYHSRNTSVTILKTVAEHTHDSITNTQIKIM